MEINKLGSITCIHGDCMDYMATLEDGAYGLAIVDKINMILLLLRTSKAKIRNTSKTTNIILK